MNFHKRDIKIIFLKFQAKIFQNFYIHSAHLGFLGFLTWVFRFFQPNLGFLGFLGLGFLGFLGYFQKFLKEFFPNMLFLYQKYVIAIQKANLINNEVY